MATMSTSGIEDLMREFTRKEQNVDGAAKKALTAGAEIIRDGFAEAVPKRTGRLSKSMEATAPTADYGGYVSTIGPTGTQHGQRNGLIGGVLEYGRSNMAPRPWFFNTLADKQDSAEEAMAKTFVKEMGIDT